MPHLRQLLKIWDSTDVLDRAIDEGQLGVPDVARPFVIGGLAAKISPLLVILPRSRDAESFTAAAADWLPSHSVSLFPAWEVLPGESLSPTLDVMGRRIQVARALSGGEPPSLVVASVRALLQKITTEPSHSILLEPGKEIAVEDLSRDLIDLGYERNYLVERPGEFSIRGGILDVFSPGRDLPVRADFFGDELTELREFSVASQRSGERIGPVEIYACRELRLDENVRARAAALVEDETSEASSDRMSDLARLAEGVSFAGMEAYLGLLTESLAPISEHLPPSARIVVCDPKQCEDRAQEFLAQASEWGGQDTEGMFSDFSEAVAVRDTIELWPFGRGDEAASVSIKGWDEFAGRPDLLVSELSRVRGKGAAIAVGAGSMAGRAQEVLSEAGLGLELKAEATLESTSITPAAIERGFCFWVDDRPALALVGAADIFGRRRAVTPTTAETMARPAALLLELATGDHVVHDIYGVGRYHGMVTRDVGGVTRDYLIIEYHGSDRLYLPTEQLDAITKYTGGESPKLSRLGTAEWEKAKTRARKAVADIAGELIVLYSKRMKSEGHAFGPDTPWQRQLEDAFPHIETPDQERTIEEVKADMERVTPMDRLICGDVGYGKTEVAVRAAFKAVQDSKQVAVLVPTTILAQQHTQTFTERFAGFPVKVAQLSRFLTQAESNQVMEDMASGKVDVVIGTHRLLQKDIKFNDLGLLIVDEEQRFGVKHKEQIKQLKAHVDVLTLTATPIPRTLEMGLTGIRDFSLMDTPPVDRRPVLTYVGEADDRMVTAAIRRELARDGQVFYVHNRVRSIKGAARRIAGLVPGARVEVAHGQMSEHELERVMVDVWDGKIDVLVSTTIIESGLDIPAMNTLIVERADLLGLSQLYQLRGRVGRARERAYAYFLYPHEAVLTDEAHERLKTLSEFTELGSGFKIALRDLEIRGAGNLLGAEQSGHIAAVGFDLYMKMMAEAVRDLSGSPPEPKLEIKLDIPADAFIPADYIARESLRMEAYRQIEKIRSVEEAASLKEEFEDRYGPLPVPLETLLKVAELRALLADHGTTEASVREGVMRLRPFPLLMDSQEVRLQRLFPKAVYKQLSATLLLPVPAKDTVTWVLDSLRAILA